MTIGRICRREVFTAAPDESVRQAARRMRDRNVGTLVVVEDGDVPVGLVTDRDLTVRVLSEERDPETTRVEDVMSAQPRRMPESTPIEDALEVMRSRELRRLLVVENGSEDGALVGVLSLDDVIELLAEEMETIGALVGKQGPL